MIVSGFVAVLLTVVLWEAVVTLLVRVAIRMIRGPAETHARRWWTLGVITVVALIVLLIETPVSISNNTHVARQPTQAQKP